MADGRPWRVRLSVRDRNADLLSDWLADYPEYEAVDDDADIWVVDRQGLDEWARQIGAAREESDCYLPVLLVSPERTDGGTGRQAPLDHADAGDLVDDVVETPTTGFELERRFRTLFRARSLSVEVTERERQYRDLIEVLPETIVVVQDGTVVYANDAAESLVGAVTEELLGRRVASLFAAEDRETVEAVVGAVERDGRLGEFREATLVSEAGDAVACDLTGVAVTYGDGPAVQLVVRDLSEQRERERRLRLFSRAIEESHQGITIADANQEDLPLVYANPAFERITGYSTAEVIGRNCRFLQGEDTEEATVAELRAAIEERRPVSVEIRNYRKDGTPFWNQLDVTPVTDESGETTHFIGLQRDVTERRERELKLKRYETIVETAGDPISVIDTQGRFVEVNEACTDTFGYSRQELLGSPAGELADEATRERLTPVVTEILAGERGQTVADGTLVTASGDRRTCEITLSPLAAGDGEPQGVVAVVRDVTSIRRREQALGMLDRVLRHNLRNDLNVVIGQAEQIRRDPGSAAVDERAATIAGTARTLMELGEVAREIEAVLRSGEDRIGVQDLAVAARESVDRARERFPDADIEATLPETAPVRAHDALGRALDELVENAVVHNDSATPSVSVSVTAADGVELRVEDDGQAIAESELRAVREGTETQLSHASGLDLWLAYWVAEVSSAEFAAEESERGGAAVVIRFD